jgi:hypothetical protein
MTPREAVVQEGRAIIRVRRVRTGQLAAVGVCPGCWNSRVRRQALLRGLAKRGLMVVHGDDAATGSYRDGGAHAPRCPWGRIGGKKR